MKKSRLVLSLALFLGLVFSPAVLFAENGCWENIRVSSSSIKNAFSGTSSVKDALLYKFALEYNSCDYASGLDPVVIKQMVLSVIKKNRIDVKDFTRLYVKDDQTGATWPVRIEDAAPYDGWKLIVDWQIDIPHGKARHFSLIADISDLRSGASLTVTFNTSNMNYFRTVDGREVYAADGSSFIEHFNGNRPPKLFWPQTSVSAETLSVVFPQSGISGEWFDFEARYSDKDDDPPAVAQVWIDLDGDGRYQEKEKFNMIPVDPEDNKNFNRGSYGPAYTYSLKITIKKSRAIKAKLHFTDGKDQAEGDSSVAGKRITDEFSFFVGAAVIFGPLKIETEFVSGEPLKVVVPIFYLYRGVTVDWMSVSENKFAPFRLMRAQVSRHGIESPEYKLPSQNFDFQEIVLFLDTGDIKSSKTAFPSLKIKYKAEDAPDQFFAESPKYDLSAVKLRVKQDISRQLIGIGDHFDYRIRVTRKPDSGLVDFYPERITFDPLDIVSFSKNEKNFGSYIVEEYTWTLASFYALTEPIPLPAFEVSWKTRASKKLNTYRVESVMVGMVPILGKADQVLSVWDAGLILWSDWKTYALIILPLALGGLVLAGFLSYWLAKRLLVWLRIWRESPSRLFRRTRRKARRQYKLIMRSLNKTELRVILLNQVKILIGLNLKLHGEYALALSAFELRKILEESRRSDMLNLLKCHDSRKILIEEFESMILDGRWRHPELLRILSNVRFFLGKIKFSPRV